MRIEDFLMRRYEKETSIVSREIAGECILVPLRNKTSRVDSLYTLNEVGSRIWQLIDGKITVREIAELLLQEYDVSAAEVEKDVVELVQQLERIGAVRGGEIGMPPH
jgi:hypothetical protein